MSSKKNVTIIIVAAVIISMSFLGTVNVSAASTVSRSQTALTLTTSNVSPAVKEKFTLSGTLTANGAPIANGLILLYRSSSSGSSNVVDTAKTAADGSYSLSNTLNSAALYQYYVKYMGSTKYLSSSSPTVTVTVTVLAASTQSTKPAPTATAKPAPTATATPAPTATATPTAATTVKQATITPTPTPSAVMSTGNATALGAVTVVQGQNFTIPLQSNPSTGYHWVPTYDNSTITLISRAFASSVSTESAIVGAGGTDLFTFQGTKQGTSIITFNNISPSNQTANSLTATVTVTAVDPIPTATKQKSVISIFASNNNPAVNQPYTIYGVLQDGNTDAPLAGQPITLTVSIGQFGRAGAVANMSTTTDTKGAYSFTTSNAAQGSYVPSVDFNNPSSGYLESSQMTWVMVGNLTPVKLTLSITPTNPAAGQSFTMSGTLTDASGNRLPNKALNIDCQIPDGSWHFRANIKTDANGDYSWTYSGGEQNQGQYYYEVIFFGDDTYSTNTTVQELAIGTLTPVTLTLNTNIANPGTGQSFTLSGKLTDANGNPLSGKEIDLYDTDTFGITNTKYTDQNGAYFFVLSEDVSGYHLYNVNFIGDQTYAYKVASLTVTVGTLASATVNTTTSNANPTADQSFTLSGYLKDSAMGTPISGATVILMRADPSGQWSEAGTASTNANGVYTFTRSESQGGHYWYYVYFAGDTKHATTSSYGAGVQVG